MTLDSRYISDALRRLQYSRPDVFGSAFHEFGLNWPLAETDVTAFEWTHRVSLPGDYRTFLTEIGNGGAGPYYGLFPLGKMDASTGEGLEPWPEGLVGDLSQPFPHLAEWNDLEGYPEDFDDEDEINAFDEKYWDSRHVNGAIPICHKGCALRIWLVTTGEQAGFLWDDNRAELGGLSPTLLQSGSHATFAMWYSEWLTDALRLIEAK